MEYAKTTDKTGIIVLIDRSRDRDRTCSRLHVNVKRGNMKAWARGLGSFACCCWKYHHELEELYNVQRCTGSSELKWKWTNNNLNLSRQCIAAEPYVTVAWWQLLPINHCQWQRMPRMMNKWKLLEFQPGSMTARYRLQTRVYYNLTISFKFIRLKVINGFRHQRYETERKARMEIKYNLKLTSGGAATDKRVNWRTPWKVGGRGWPTNGPANEPL